MPERSNRQSLPAASGSTSRPSAAAGRADPTGIGSRPGDATNQQSAPRQPSLLPAPAIRILEVAAAGLPRLGRSNSWTLPTASGQSGAPTGTPGAAGRDLKSTRLNSSH